jgi:hypothetical protein
MIEVSFLVNTLVVKFETTDLFTDNFCELYKVFIFYGVLIRFLLQICE